MKVGTLFLILILVILIIPNPKPTYKYQEWDRVTLHDSGKVALIVERTEGYYLVNYVDDYGAIRQKYVSEDQVSNYIPHMEKMFRKLAALIKSIR